MKIKIIRESGRPVKLDQLEKFEIEYKSRYDVLAADHGKNMLALEKSLEDLDKELAPKYDTIEEIEYPKSARQFRQLIADYGNIMTALHAETEELVFIIIDLGGAM